MMVEEKDDLKSMRVKKRLGEIRAVYHLYGDKRVSYMMWKDNMFLETYMEGILDGIMANGGDLLSELVKNS